MATTFEQLAARNACQLARVERSDGAAAPDAGNRDGAGTAFSLAMDDGRRGSIRAFPLFDGVTLLFNDIPLGACTWHDCEPQELQLDYCRRGRFELETEAGGEIALREGELAVHDQRVRKRLMRYPMPLFTGFTLRIEYARGAETLARREETAHVDFDAFRRRFAGTEGCRTLAPDTAVRSLLDSFWEVDGRATRARLRLKALELVALLDATDKPAWCDRAYLRASASAELQRGAALLAGRLDAQLSLADAARAAGMGVSSFKERFSQVYGMTPMAFRRRCRIEEAARMLRETDASVAYVAAAVGYRNPSKFAAAFAAANGSPPSAYRRAALERAGSQTGA